MLDPESILTACVADATTVVSYPERLRCTHRRHGMAAGPCTDGAWVLSWVHAAMQGWCVAGRVR